MQELSLSTITRNFGCLIYVRCFRNKMSGIFFKTTNYCLCVAGISEGKERFCQKLRSMCGTHGHLDALIAFPQLIIIYPLHFITQFIHQLVYALVLHLMLICQLSYSQSCCELFKQPLLMNARMNQHANIVSFVVCYKNGVPQHQVKSGCTPGFRHATVSYKCLLAV